MENQDDCKYCPHCGATMVQKPLFTSMYWDCDFCSNVGKPVEIDIDDLGDPFDPFWDPPPQPNNHPLVPNWNGNSYVPPPVPGFPGPAVNTGGSPQPPQKGVFSWQCNPCRGWTATNYGDAMKCNHCGYVPPGQNP